MDAIKAVRPLLADIFQSLKTPAEYLQAARTIETGSFPQLKPLRTVFVATFTMDFVKPYLTVEGAHKGFQVQSLFAPFNQIEQQVLDRCSFLYQSQPDVIALALRLEEIAPNLTDRFLTLSESQIKQETGAVLARLKTLIEETRAHSKAAILVFNFAAPAVLAAGLADAALAHSQTAIIQDLNNRLAAVCRPLPDVHIFDFARFWGECGLRAADPKLWYMGRIPMNGPAQILLAGRLARYLRALKLPACKCLVLDLDQTLWGGVLGEDGPAGIALGEEYPGVVFKDFQRRLLALRDRGVILALASKNNEQEVVDVFQGHPDMLIKLEDFSARQIHWQDKAASLNAIADELNIATDAMAFFDDNAVEREWVRAQLPAVTVIEVPANPMDYGKALEESGAFDQLVILDEDRKRAGLYRDQKERESLYKGSVSLEDFLGRLNIKVALGCIDGETLPRVAQLIAKTNQFNMTTRRYSAAELESMLANGHAGLWIRAADRFGDYGLVGAAVAKEIRPAEWMIDVFLLSCRALGKNIEVVLLDELCDMVKKKGAKAIWGEHIPTPKNAPAKDFYAQQQFRQNSGLWCRDLTPFSFQPLEYIEVARVYGGR